jgi:hypothetical protein
MPITLPEIAKHLDTIGWKYKVDEENGHAMLGFGTTHHVDLEGDKHIAIWIEVEAEGAYVQVVLPRVYNLKDCKFKGPVLAVLSEIAFRTRSLQCEYDSSDGEVRYAVDTWVLDNTLTAHQLEMMVRIAVELLEEYEPVVRHAMATGKIDFGLAVKREEPKSDDGPAALPPEIAELLTKAGGLEGLRAAVERHGHGGGA